MFLKKTYFIAASLVIISVFLVFANWRTEMAIIFFPIDYESKFSYVSTQLVALDDLTTVDWTSTSESESKNYLRQDVSLLFVNGKLAGIQNKWMQNESLIEQTKRTEINTNALLQAISFHHGEIHEQDMVKSIQAMSTDYLYIINQDAFHTPKTAKEKRESEKLENQIERKLTKNWEHLLRSFNIDEDQYLLYPFIDIPQLALDLSELTSQKESDRIIGQLWEGLYKNYILQAIELTSNDYMPLILLAKDRSHLYVLYEMNEEKQQLIQQISLDD